MPTVVWSTSESFRLTYHAPILGLPMLIPPTLYSLDAVIAGYANGLNAHPPTPSRLTKGTPACPVPMDSSSAASAAVMTGTRFIMMLLPLFDGFRLRPMNRRGGAPRTAVTSFPMQRPHAAGPECSRRPRDGGMPRVLRGSLIPRVFRQTPYRGSVGREMEDQSRTRY